MTLSGRGEQAFLDIKIQAASVNTGSGNEKTEN